MAFKFLVLGLTAFVLVAESLASPIGEPYKTVCYYESWAHWRAAEGKMDPADIDSNQCTHLVYSFLGIKKDTFELELPDPYLMDDLHEIAQFAQYKGKAKALIAVGGPSSSGQFAAMVATDQGRSAFVHSVLDFVEQYNFDGIMLHWFGQSSHSMELVALLDKFHEEKFASRYTLAIAVPANGATEAITYKVEQIAKLVDFITVLTFDFGSPTFPHSSPFLRQLKYAEWYHQQGAPRSKLVLTMPLFARTWITEVKEEDFNNPQFDPVKEVQHSTYPYTHNAPAGPLSRVDGYLSYNELCTMMLANPKEFTVVFNPVDYSALAVNIIPPTAENANNKRQIEYFSFENRQTLALKAHDLSALGYGGIAVYALDNDDFHGVCGQGKWPLMRAINENYVALPQKEETIVLDYLN